MNEIKDKIAIIGFGASGFAHIWVSKKKDLKKFIFMINQLLKKK